MVVIETTPLHEDKAYNALLCRVLCKKKKWICKDVGALLSYTPKLVSKLANSVTDEMLSEYLQHGEHKDELQWYIDKLPVTPRISPCRKFTDTEVLAMRRDFREHQDYHKLIEKYRNTRSSLHDILRGKIYSSVPERISLTEYRSLIKKAKDRCRAQRASGG